MPPRRPGFELPWGHPGGLHPGLSQGDGAGMGLVEWGWGGGLPWAQGGCPTGTSPCIRLCLDGPAPGARMGMTGARPATAQGWGQSFAKSQGCCNAGANFAPDGHCLKVSRAEARELGACRHSSLQVLVCLGLLL